MKRSEAKQMFGKIRALMLIDALIKYHAGRMSKLSRYMRLARAYNNKLWEKHLLNLHMDAFKQTGRWNNERRRGVAFKGK